VDVVHDRGGAILLVEIGVVEGIRRVAFVREFFSAQCLGRALKALHSDVSGAFAVFQLDNSGLAYPETFGQLTRGHA